MYKLASIILLFSLFVFTGCKKLLDIEATNLVNEENAWSTINDARSALLGTYGLLRTALAEDEANWMYGELRNSDFVANGRSDIQAVIDGHLDRRFPMLSRLSSWRKFYAVINSAFLFIDKSGQIMDKDPQYTRLNHDIDIAQMKSLIGLTYFYLARIWGDVPLITKSYDGTFPHIPRSKAGAVVNYAESLLKEAVNVLPMRYGDINADYFAGLYYGGDIARWGGALINKTAANAILAHLAAWDGRYLDASTYADVVLNNMGEVGIAPYSVANLTAQNGFFYGVKSAQVFALGMSYSNGESTQDGHIENLTLAEPLISRKEPVIFIPSNKILNIFNVPGDDRFHIDSSGETVSPYFTNLSSEFPVFSKIKAIGNGEDVDNTAGGDLNVFITYSSPIVFSRYEEVRLLKAECLYAVGAVNDAKDILNSLRSSRGISLDNELTNSDDILEEIFKERKRELLGEGWSWFDYIRYKKLKGDDNDFNSLVNNGGIYWPVAKEVMDSNPLITQTPYWD